MDVLQNLGALTGWPGLIFMILSVIFGGLYVRRTSKANADEIAKKANVEAIEALQRQVDIMQDRIAYLEKALEEIGIKVGIDGKVIHIKNGNKEGHDCQR